MANYYQGTIATLQDIIAREKQANLMKETPQYRQALFNLMQAKEEAVRNETIRQQLQNLPVDKIPEFLLRQGQGKIYGQQLENQGLVNRIKLRANTEEELAKTKHGYKMEEIEARAQEQRKTKKIPVRYNKPLATKEKVFAELYKGYQDSGKTLDEYLSGLSDNEKKIWDSMFRSMTTTELIEPLLNTKPIVEY